VKKGNTPIQCWGCKEDNIYKDSPHRGDKIKTMHNIQEDTIVEDMSINITRICGTLKDRQEKNQCRMIVVEGKIINQYVSILIDSRASHNYIDPKVGIDFI
jgi:hypothetical protein